MNALKALAKGAGITFIGILISKIISFFFRITLGRGLGPEEYGLIMLAIAVFSFGQKAANLSVHKGIKRFMPVETETKPKNDLIFSASIMALPSAVIASIAIFSLSEPIAVNLLGDPNLEILLQVLAPAIPFAILSGILLDSMVAHNKMKYFSAINHVFLNLAKLGTAIIAILIGLGSFGVAIGFGISFVASALIAAAVLYTKVIDFRLTRPTRMKQLLDYSWPLFFAGFMTFILSWTDTVMIGFFLDSAQVGIYNAAFPLAASLIIFMSAISKVGFPIMSRIAENEEQNLDTFFKTSTRWILTFATPAVLLVFLFPEEVLLITFGDEYAEAYEALRILAVGFFISMIVGPTEALIKATDHTRLTLLNTSLTAFGNVILNILLIPLYGILGAAIASMISKIIGNFAAAVEAIVLEDVFGLSKNVLPVFASSIGGITVVYSAFQFYGPSTPLWTLLPGAVLYGAVYLALMIALKGFRPRDREIIISAGRKIDKEKYFERLANVLIR